MNIKNINSRQPKCVQQGSWLCRLKGMNNFSNELVQVLNKLFNKTLQSNHSLNKTTFYSKYLTGIFIAITFSK